MNWNKILLKQLILICIAAIFLAGCSSSEEPEEEQWELVWSDEFDGTAGVVPDSTKWAFDIGTDWGNAQLEYDTNRPENASLDGQGNLAIVARAESFQGRSYTSARIVTKDLFERTYGRFEARMRLPWGQGIWPAFWLLGANIDDVGWPLCGEIDIMEYRGQEPARIHGSLHGPGYSGGQPVTEQYNLVNDRFDTGFHVFSVEWDANSIKWFVDGNLYQAVKSTDLPGEWVFDHPFFIILNLAVGGNYVGSPNASTVFPQTMLIDYVRVYKAAN
ncbi:MAG: glycoside hydrolase family 16 protein [Calditrichia bacterium]|nr:glycoside hydrolase family 16 protein [Calditrichota bacterium]